MKTLITGGSGFIGSHLVENLIEDGWDVTVVSKDAMFSAALEATGARVHLADIRDAAAMAPLLAEVDVVFHLAGVTRARDTAGYYRGNHLATRDFLHTCAAHAGSLQRFVYVSSLTAVGPRLGIQEVTELTPYHPVSHYGRSKMLAEIEVLDMADRLPVTIVRPSGVYGPRDRDLFRYFTMIHRGIEPLIRSGSQELNFVHVADVVRGIRAAALHPAALGEVFFIGDAVNHTSAEICGAVAMAQDRRPLVFSLPASLVYLTGAIGEGAGRVLRREVFFNLQKVREALQDAWTCSIHKARVLIGYEPRVALAEGILSTYEWYRREGWMGR